MMHNKTLIMILALASMGSLACQEEDEERYLGPLLGVWEEIVDHSNLNDPKYAGNCEGPDNEFEGTLKFNEDWGFRLNYADSGFGHYTFGDSKGIFSLKSDSVLVLDHPDVNEIRLLQLLDSLVLVAITDTLFVEYSLGDQLKCLRYWKKIE